MKKWFILLLVLCLVPLCGLAEDKVELYTITDHGDCTATVHFNNPLSANTTIIWMHNGYTGNGSNMGFDQVSNASSYTLKELAPGEKYVVGVMNEVDFNTLAPYFFILEEPAAFDDFDFRLYDANLACFRIDSIQSDYGYNYANDYSASKIAGMLEEQLFMVKVDFRHPVFNSDFTLPILAVVKSPMGFITTQASTVTISQNSKGFWQTMAVMNPAFEEMIANDGGIHSGEYEVTIYLDGKLVNSDTFTIR